MNHSYSSDDFSVEELREKFENYDSNGNGHLTQSEFINLFSSYTGSELSSEQASQVSPKDANFRPLIC